MGIITMAAHFIPPVIQDNAEGWGPCSMPTEFKDIPYQPFSKGDRIGKVSDWTGQFQDRKFWNKYQSQFGAGSQQYAYYHEGDDDSFQLVDTSKPQKTAYQRNRQRFNNVKLKLPEIAKPTDLYNAGKMEVYDKLYDRVTTKNERNLAQNSRIFHKVTTTDDPIIRKLAGKGNVFGTDAIISTLMCSTRSVASWDVIVQRVGKKLFFDKRDDSAFDLQPVYETTQEQMQEEGINAPNNLALESTFINQNFSQQCLKKSETYSFDHPNPFASDDGEEVASVGYRYRKFELGDGINLVVRCEHDACLPTGPNQENLYLNIKTLNEFDPKASKIDWRQKLDSQIGSVLATELKNNSCKIAKWTCNAILAGSDYLKLGYVSRVAPNDSSRHVILGTQQFKPKEFANQIALDMDNAWGILRVIIDTCLKCPEGKYLLLRDPNKGVIRLYDIPDNSFESDDDDSEEEGDDEEESDSEEDEKKETK